MARWWEFARWRRVLMQVVMWVVLGATVALAALVNYQREQALRLDLSLAVTDGNLQVWLPDGWHITTHHPRLPLVAAAREAGRGPLARVVSVFQEPVSTIVPPEEYLLESGLLSDHYLIDGAPADVALEPISVGGRPGVLVTGWRRVRSETLEAEVRKELFACTVLPSRQAITIKLEGFGQPTESDRDLIRRLSAAMVIEDQTNHQRRGGRVNLPGGTRLDAPPGFLIVAEQDPNRIERQMASDEAPYGWMAIDLVPSILLPEDGPEALLTMLSIRDAAWAGAHIQPLPQGGWRMDRARQGAAFPSRAYVLAGASGQALLAVFRGAGNEAHFDAVWSQLSASVRFSPAADVNAMLAAGVEEVQTLRSRGLAELLGELREEQWWLWYHDPSNHSIGWTRFSYGAGEWSARRETRLRGPDRRLVRVVRQWQSSPDLRTYRCEVEVSSASAESDFEPMPAQTIEVNDGWTTTTQEHEPGASLQRRPVPAQFVPGGWLPLIIGQLGERPMVLRTDSFLGYEAVQPTVPLTLVIAPSDDVPRRAAGEATPLRCISVQVNGSGEVSRWYFTADGELECVDFAGRMLRRDHQAGRFDFAQDKRMMP